MKESWNHAATMVLHRLMLLLVCSAAGCGSVYVDAPTVRPPVVPRGPLRATVTIDVSGVPAETSCSRARDHSAVRSICIERLRPALGDGLSHVMSRYMQVVPGAAADYRAELAVTRLYHFEKDSVPMGGMPGQGAGQATWASRVIFAMVWQFRLRRTSDQMPVAQGSETTELREPIDDVGEADEAVEELMSRMLVRVSELVQDASVWDQPRP